MIYIFDYLEEIKIGLFNKVSYTKSSGLEIDNGSNKNYKIKDRLPLESLYYNYPKNFLVLNMDQNKINFLKIRGEKYIGRTDKIEEIEIQDFKKIYFQDGRELQIEYLEEIPMFLKSLEEFKNHIKKIELNKNKLMIEIRDSSDELMFIKKKPLIDKLNEEMKICKKQYQEKWFVEKEKDIIKFGMYLTCLLEKLKDFQLIQEVGTLLKKEDTVPINKLIKYKDIDIENFEKDLISLKDNFSDYISINNNIDKRYLDWLDLNNRNVSANEVNATKDLILNIQEILESEAF
ncbi:MULTISPECIES: hypothetical protein [unclassified Clostridioides]|uniref:hypothetical protein n=1 Tax=unclassified Clostridioides TaxID=2635829 RepID=UPI001D102322|nr:hypothetical protein [Clostridioides sp. ES-S-0145-01]MCC0682257.1 hypothetical protein [Clostridioides sp. ES-S-0005-03]MCC0705514.1 hypothetical protein [Clostridioides sp. ES-S-0190-01]UDN63924.1 hypothetical protein IC758_20145 [Clostridioides sp. ES-W-0016-02]